MNSIATNNTDIEGRKLHSIGLYELPLVEFRLTEVCELIGIKQSQDRDIMKKISKLIPQYYPHLSLGDIGKAFLDNVAQDKPIEMYYNSFDWSFVAKVITQYVKHQQHMKSQPPRPTDSKQLNEASDESKWRADYISMLKWIMQENGNVPPMGNFWQCFQYLKLTGRINPDKNEMLMTVHVVHQWVGEQVAKIDRPHERQDFRNDYDQSGDRFKNKCREIYFVDWIKTEMGSDPIKWLEKEIMSLEVNTA